MQEDYLNRHIDFKNERYHTVGCKQGLGSVTAASLRRNAGFDRIVSRPSRKSKDGHSLVTTCRSGS